MCNDNKTCISNYQVCDGVRDCQNSEDENPALCRIEIRSSQRSGETGTTWDAHCTSRLEAQIEWHVDQEYVKLNDLVHANITEEVRTLKCANRASCRTKIIQVRNRSDNTFVSKLSISPLNPYDFGYYYCQVLEHRSKQFHLKLTALDFLSQSHCYHNAESVEDLRIGTQDCAAPVHKVKDESEKCRLLEKERNCIRDRIRHECGPHMTHVVDNIAHIRHELLYRQYACPRYTFCKLGEFSCVQEKFTCLPGKYACDGHIDCRLSEDETNCKLDLTEKTVEPRFNENFVLQCKASGGAELDQSIYWFMQRLNLTKQLPINISIPLLPYYSNDFEIKTWGVYGEYTSELRITRLTHKFLGTFWCTTGHLMSSKFELKLEDNTEEVDLCDANNFLCNANKTCIPNRYVCDSVKHCKDSEDENPDLCSLMTVDASMACTPRSLSAACERTSTCRLSAPGNHTSGRRLNLLDSVSFRYSLQYVKNIFNHLKHSVNELRDFIVTTRHSWKTSVAWTPAGQRGLRRLYPVHNTKPGMADIHTSISHSGVLGELRWWLTAIEEHALQLKACGFLGPTDGPYLVSKVVLLSRDLNSLLNLLSINPRTFTAQTLCAQVSRSITNSETKKAQFTSVALRDVERAVDRIQLVLNHCEISSHTEGQHSVRLQCQTSYQHLFYETRPSDVKNLYSHTDFLN
ncbi:low-density lipoprotein receptor-related protein 1B [Elysia marginata]|uniref:Low-density lipoprotein receptor-related protein 1B n=1 Tax=Elysia marginata TaxID=1093978 RepID=A0AAV4ILH6_9GAST|nr:low-density lipoprotein receptor-related protein 1B [Elysia marginata]